MQSRLRQSWLLRHWALKDSHNSPEYCPCPVDPRKSACSVTVHCCGCRGPSVLRGPVELLEEAVPDELWPPGDGKDGLLYGRHPSSGDINEGRTLLLQWNTFKVLKRRDKKLFWSSWRLQSGHANRLRQTEATPQRTLRLAASMSYDEGKYNNRGTFGCCGTPCCRAS